MIDPHPNGAGPGRQDAGGLTLDDYASAIALPIDFLKAQGLSQLTYESKPALRIPYYGTGGEEIAVRFRTGLEGGDRFRWKSGSKPCLYGLDRLGDARRMGSVVLVEGERDCHTLWFHRIHALGVPGVGNWREERDAHHLDGIETIFVVTQPDRGGEPVRQWLSRSTIRHRVKLISLSVKDPSALHLEDPDEFPRRWQVLCLGAIPWAALEAETNAAERAEAWERCSDLALKRNILNEFASDLSRFGVVGERRIAMLLYLAITPRFNRATVQPVICGQSVGGWKDLEICREWIAENQP